MKKILLSIKPIFVERILQGSKLVEYRKRLPKMNETHQVLIYRSQDLKKIVAEFTIGDVVEGLPESVWKQTKAVGGISEDDFFSYFANSCKAYAMEIKHLRVFKEPRELASLGVKRAPMSFQYVNDEISL